MRVSIAAMLLRTEGAPETDMEAASRRAVGPVVRRRLNYVATTCWGRCSAAVLLSSSSSSRIRESM